MLSTFIQSAVVVLGLAESILANPGLDLAARASKGCNADNCARQVTGTHNSIPSATRRADCSSYLSTTITYDPIQATAVTIAPSAYPTYVSACSGGSVDRYSSACSCWGVQATTTTIYPYDCTADVKLAADNCGCQYSGQCYTSFEGNLLDYGGVFDKSDCLSKCSARDDCLYVAYGKISGNCALLGSPSSPETDLDYDKVTVGYTKENDSCTCPFSGGDDGHNQD